MSLMKSFRLLEQLLVMLCVSAAYFCCGVGEVFRVFATAYFIEISVLTLLVVPQDIMIIIIRFV